MMTITRATLDDLPAIVRILDDASAWLRERGTDQWPQGFAPPERIRPYIARAEMWLVCDGTTPAATVRIACEADAPSLWNPQERADLALYVSKLAIDRGYAGRGLGAAVLRWISDYASRLGYRWVRLDAWRTNTALHAYYLAHGWDYIRTVDAPGRNSTALFQQPAQADPEARAMFATEPENSPWLTAGARVQVIGGSHRGTGTVTEISAPYEHEVVRSSAMDQLPGYWVQLDGARFPVLCNRADVQPLGRDGPLPRQVAYCGT